MRDSSEFSQVIERDLEIVRNGELNQCHMLEVRRIARNLTIEIPDRKRDAIRTIEKRVESGDFKVRELDDRSLMEVWENIDFDATGFMQSVKNAFGSE